MNTENEKPLYEEMVNLIEADLESYPPHPSGQAYFSVHGGQLGDSLQTSEIRGFSCYNGSRQQVYSGSQKRIYQMVRGSLVQKAAGRNGM